MKNINRIGVALFITMAMAMTIASGTARAQGSADDHAAVWAAVEAIWAAEARADNDDLEQMLATEFMGWPKGSPTPRSKTSTEIWREFGQDQTKTLQHELYPLSIVVHGDMAVAHYVYTNAVQARDKSVEVSNGRYTDVLVRDNGVWKFIAWHGGDDSAAN